jgi:hypothetical protein
MGRNFKKHTFMTIYERAKRYGVQSVATCVGIGQYQWDEYMKGHTRANRREVVKIALQAGVIDEEQAREELRRPWFNPYNHYKTKTHIIYVHSGIEHFIEVNQ